MFESRPLQRWTYDPSTNHAACAAAYGVGVAKNHAFVVGNKRTASQVMYVFLGLNGHRLAADEREVVSLVLDVATSRIDEVQLAEWIRAHIAAR